MTRLTHAALRYADAGFRVLPCRPGNKQPIGACVPHGFSDATRDARTITAWWRRHPDANIGIVPGSAGFVVVDVDNAAAADTVRERFGVDVSAHPCTVATARGWHLYFRHTGAPLGQPKLAPDVDIRSQLGFVLAPPSVHPTGAVYRWATRVLLQDAPPLPFSIVRAVTEPKPLPRQSAPRPESEEAVPVDIRIAKYVDCLPTGLGDGGGRKRTAFFFAEFLTHTIGLSIEDARAHLRAWNGKQAVPLSDVELERKLREVTRRRAA